MKMSKNDGKIVAISEKGVATMAKDSQRKKDWDKKYMVFVAFKLFRETENGSNDQDVIDFLEGKNRSETIKLALREYMKNHKEET